MKRIIDFEFKPNNIVFSVGNGIYVPKSKIRLYSEDDRCDPCLAWGRGRVFLCGKEIVNLHWTWCDIFQWLLQCRVRIINETGNIRSGSTSNSASFYGAHELVNNFNGIWLDSELWFVKSKNGKMRIRYALPDQKLAIEEYFDFDQVINDLDNIGSTIASYMKKSRRKWVKQQINKWETLIK